MTEKIQTAQDFQKTQIQDFKNEIVKYYKSTENNLEKMQSWKYLIFVAIIIGIANLIVIITRLL